VFRIGGNTFYDRKNKILMKIPKFKRSGIGLIAEFRGILNVFPNQADRGTDREINPVWASLTTFLQFNLEEL
jgi:hypothetical protein